MTKFDYMNSYRSHKLKNICNFFNKVIKKNFFFFGFASTPSINQLKAFVRWVYSLHIEKQVDWIRPVKAIDDDH